MIEYVVGDLDIDGSISSAGDIAGQFNRSNPFRSLPQLKANFTANYSSGPHNFRGVVRYIDSYEDERGDITGDGSSEIDSQATLDLFYNVQAPWGIDFGLSMVNAFDEDPPFAQFDVNYDPYTHNPFGRTVKVSLSKTFGPNS